MARDIKLIIKGDNRSAEAALKDLQRTGSNVTHALERDFDQLGIKSNMVFDAKRKSAQDAYANIKKSGMSSANDIADAERGLANKLKRIDEDQYGKRLSMAQKFRKNAAAITAAAGVAYAAVRIGKEAIDEAKVFETALVDLGKVGVENIGEVRAEIMAMPGELGSATELVKGYYQAISAGVTDPKKAMELLTTAAKTAKAGHVEQGEVIKGLTKVMAGYGGAIKTASEAADLLFNMEKFGQTNVAELVPVIGGLASISGQLNVIPSEMAAVFSAITQTAGSTAQAATQYEAIMTGFIKPTKSMSEVFKALGVESGKQLIGEQGLSGALIAVGEAARESFGANGLGKIFESKEALIGLGPLYADSFEKVKTTTNEIKESTGAADQAFKDWQLTFQSTEDLFNNTIGKIMIELGTELAPQVKEAMSGIANWAKENGPEIVQFFKGLGTVISGVTTVVGTFLGGIKSATEFAAELAADATLIAQGYGSQMARDNTAYNEQTMGSSSFDSAEQYTFSSPPFVSANGEPLAVGTSYVPRTGMYQLHRGEEVRTRNEAGSGGGNVTIAPQISISMQGSSTDPAATGRELARLVEPELRKLGLRYRAA